MCLVIVLASSTALFSTTKISGLINTILVETLPETARTFQVAQATNNLVSSGVPLETINTELQRQEAFQRVDDALDLFEQSMADFGNTTNLEKDVRRLSGQLMINLQQYRGIVEQRLDLIQKRERSRQKLLLNLQSFQQELTYRVRILGSDSDIITILMNRSPPATNQVTEIIRSTVDLIPVAQFYSQIEAINSQLMATDKSPNRTELALSRQIFEAALSQAEKTFEKLSSEVSSPLIHSFAELRNIALGKDGLFALRDQELRLLLNSQGLIKENKSISHEVGLATSQLVKHGFDEMNQAGVTADESRSLYMKLMVGVAVLGLLGIAALMYFHVMKHIIVRLSWLSTAMQNLAKGYLEDIRQLPVGNDELGRLGSAVLQFRTTAIDHNRREAELRESHASLEKANLALKQKTGELETANQQLAELSISDALTGLANRRRFDDALEVEWSRARRTGQSIALMMIDIDHFKEFNDTYGHQMGDESLRQVAHVFKSNMRRTADLAARYGGEEFVAILVDTNLAGVKALAEVMRQSVEALAIPHSHSEPGIVTISIGISATSDREIQSAEELLGLADKALYKAKENGRNCVVAA